MVVKITYKDLEFYEFPNMDARDAKENMENNVYEKFGDDAYIKIDRIDEWEEDGEIGTDIDVAIIVEKIYDVGAKNEYDAMEEAVEMIQDEIEDFDIDMIIHIGCCCC